MHASLEQQLKEFEKELSILLVRFMKIYDEYQRANGGKVPPGVASPLAALAPRPPEKAPTVGYV